MKVMEPTIESVRESESVTLTEAVRFALREQYGRLNPEAVFDSAAVAEWVEKLQPFYPPVAKITGTFRSMLQRERNRGVLDFLEFLGRGKYQYIIGKLREYHSMKDDSKTKDNIYPTQGGDMPDFFVPLHKASKTQVKLDRIIPAVKAPMPAAETLLPVVKGVKRALIEMNREVWLDNERYPYWPFERDFVKHGEKILAQPDFDPNHPTLGQACHLVTVVGTGKTYKINAMTTSYLCVSGKVNFPAKVHGVHFYVPSMEEGHKIYEGFDASFESKGSLDRLVTGFKIDGIACQSKRFAGGQGTTGISTAYHALHGERSNSAVPDIQGAINRMRGAIVATDRIIAEAEGKRAAKVMGGSPAIVAMILSYAQLYKEHKNNFVLHREEWYAFWRKVLTIQGMGAHSEPESRVWHVLKDGPLKTGGGREATFKTAADALYCWDRRDEGVGTRLMPHRLETFLPIWERKKTAC